MRRYGGVITRDNLQSVIGSIHKLASRQVFVGIPSSTSERKDDEPITNAEIGYIQEHGSPVNNLPARPFLVPGVESSQDAIMARLRKAGEGALGSDSNVVDEQLNAAGLIGQNAVRAKITNGDFAPLSASTLAGRRRRGRTGTRPLIDTGQLRNSITYVIRTQGGGGEADESEASAKNSEADKVKSEVVHGDEGLAEDAEKLRRATVEQVEDFAEAAAEGVELFF